MKPEHKKYIESNVGKRSASQIAADLGIRERNVRKYLKEKKIKIDEDRQPPETAVARQKIKAAYLVLLAAAVFGFYANSLGGPFLFDDQALVKDNPLIRSAANIPKFFKTDIFCDSITLKPVSNSYRPVQMITYAADFRLWGENPIGFHITNILIHIFAVLLVFILVNKLFKNIFISSIVSLWFGINPVNTAVVSYISGRADILVAAFMLLSLILYIDFTNNRRVSFLLLSALSYLVAVYSKEYAILTLPFILVLYNATFNKKDLLNFRHYLCYISIMIFYLIMRVKIFHGMAVRNLELSHFSISTRVLTSLKTLFIDARILFFPYDLHLGRTTQMENSIFSSPDSILTVLGILFFIWILVITYKKWGTGKSAGSGMVFFGIAWFSAAMIPLLNIFPLQSFLADSWLYFSSIGLYIVAGSAFNHIKQQIRQGDIFFKAIFYFFISAMFLCYGFATIERNKDYQDELRFYLSNVKWRPIVKFYASAGHVCRQRKDFTNAIKYLEKAIEANSIYPSRDVVKAYYELGQTYLDISDYKGAAEAFEKVAASDNEVLKNSALHNLSYIKQKMGN